MPRVVWHSTRGMPFTPTNPLHLEAIVTLLQESLRLPPDHPSLNRSYLGWKYYEPGPARPGSRSFALEENGSIVAHAAIWPVQLRLQNGLRSGISFGDWAASEGQPGAGLLLLQKLLKLESFVLVTGGADITRRILPRMGFQHWADREVYAKVLRPLKQLITRGHHAGWKEPARVARNFWWSLAGSSPTGRWTAEESAPDEQVLPFVAEQPGSLHNGEFLRFVLRCPIAKFRYFLLRKNGLPQGYAVLGVIRGQGRIADLRIASKKQEDWNAVIGILLKQFAKDAGVCEVMSLGSAPALNAALLANGFRVRDRQPLVIFDPQGEIAQEPVPYLGMLEDDASFLHHPLYPYLT